MAFLNKGLEIVVRDERPERAAGIAEAVADDTIPAAVDGGADGVSAATHAVVERRFRYDDGLVDYVKHLNSHQGRGPPQHHRVRGGQRRRSA